MKVPVAALLLLSSFGTTISSSNAKMVEFQVSSDGDTNKQKKNMRKLQDGLNKENPLPCTPNLDECKKNCADLYCECDDTCNFDNGTDYSEACQDCAASINKDEDLVEKCDLLCFKCDHQEEKLKAPINEVEVQKSTRAPVENRAEGTRFLDGDDEEINWDDFFECKDVPTISPRPSMTPSVSSAPSTSAAPTTDCGIIDCDMTHSASCNPDPHYTVWSGTVSFYDFQGSCDQIAIDNSNLQLQMKTRGRGYYSTITEVALKMKASDELLTIDGTTVVNNITPASLGAAVSQTSNYVKISFPTPAGESYIKIFMNSYGMSIQVYGIGYIFGGSEGMLGSWDNGGVNFQNGTAFDLTGGYSDVKARSFELAQDWSVPSGSNHLPNPSSICVPESVCQSDDTDCGTRRLGEEVVPGCEKSCFASREIDKCFTDLALSIPETPCSEQFQQGSLEINKCYQALESKPGVDKSWACQETYVNPVIVPETFANFRPQGSEMCMADNDICGRIGGYCAPDCEDGPFTVCVPGLCSSSKSAKGQAKMDEYDRRLKKGKKDDGEKMPKTTKAPKATKSPKSSDECMCKVNQN